MAYWDGPLEGYPPEHRDFARVWQKAEQIVFSRTLTRAPHASRVSSGSSIPRQLGNSSANRRTTSSLAAPNWQHLRSNPISSTNVTCFSIRSSSAAESRHSEPPYDRISNCLTRDVSAPEQSTCAIACGALSVRRDCRADFHHGLLGLAGRPLFVPVAAIAVRKLLDQFSYLTSYARPERCGVFGIGFFLQNALSN